MFNPSPYVDGFVEGAIIGWSLALCYCLWIFRQQVWDVLADWCLLSPYGPSVLDGMWLTTGDPSWGYTDGPNGRWVSGRGLMPEQHKPW